MKFYEYAGMSYEQASRAAEQVIRVWGWYQGFERLKALHEIMERSNGSH
jgi:hypothetical protein